MIQKLATTRTALADQTERFIARGGASGGREWPNVHAYVREQRCGEDLVAMRCRLAEASGWYFNRLATLPA